MSNNLAAINSDKRDDAFTVRVKAIYKNRLIRPLERFRNQFMNSGEISRGFASNDHCTDLSFPPIPNIGHMLLVVRTIGKPDRVKASCFVKASRTFIRLEAPQFECADPAGLCCID
jgi:hypothetical protein